MATAAIGMGWNIGPVRRLEIAAAAFSEVLSKSLYDMKALATA
jgi:hypothetical protein